MECEEKLSCRKQFSWQQQKVINYEYKRALQRNRLAELEDLNGV